MDGQLRRSLRPLSKWHGPYNSLVQQLLKRMVLLNSTCTGKHRYKCMTPLQLAAQGGYKDIVHFLATGTDEMKRHGWVTLQSAAVKGIEPVIQVLLNNGISVSETDGIEDGELCFLHYEMLRRHFPKVKTLQWDETLSSSAETLARTTVHYSLTFMSIVLCLVRNGGNANQFNQFRNSALCAAVDYNEMESVKLLLDFGANIDDMNESGLTVVMKVASTSCDLSMMQLLLSRKPKILINRLDRSTLLHFVMRKCHFGCIDFLVLNNYVDINATQKGGATALQLACKFGNVKAITCLLAYDCDIDVNADTIVSMIHNCPNKKLLMNHCERLRAMGRSYSDHYRQMFGTHQVNYVCIYKQCLDELELIKTFRVSNNSTITLYDVLVGSLHRVAARLRNVKMYLLLRDVAKAPIYADMLRCKIRLAYKRILLLDMLNDFEKPCRLYKLPYLCGDHILQYLSNKDLKSMKEALHGVDENR